MSIQGIIIASAFVLGWNFGLAQTRLHGWIVAPMAAYIAASVIRFLWAVR